MNIRENSQILNVFLAFLFFILLKPYFVWGIPYLEQIVISIIVICLFVFNYLRILNSVNFLFFILIFIVMFWDSRDSNVFGIIPKILPALFVFIRFELLVNIFVILKRIYVITTFLSIISYLLWFLGLNFIVGQIDSIQITKPFSYTVYPLLVSYGDLSFSNFNFRFSGFFDEPGVVGSLSLIFLFPDDFSFKTFENKVIYISGIISFSLFFYIGIFTLKLMRYNIKLKIAFLFFMVLFYYSTNSNNLFRNTIWDRIVFQDGKLVGDNRSTLYLQEAYASFLNSDYIFVGRDSQYVMDYGYGSSSYMLLLLRLGIIVFTLLIMAFLQYSYMYFMKSKDFFIYFILFLFMLYQRPVILLPTYLFLFLSIVHVRITYYKGNIQKHKFDFFL